MLNEIQFSFPEEIQNFEVDIQVVDKVVTMKIADAIKSVKKGGIYGSNSPDIITSVLSIIKSCLQK